MDYNDMLRGKAAIVTGAAMGIGKQIAITFAKQGAKVIAIDINKEKLEEVLKTVIIDSPDSKMYVCDVGNLEELTNVINTIKKEKILVNILVNGVGINNRMLAHEISENDFDRILETNFKSAYRLIKAFVPDMIELGGGNIVNISSIHSLMTMPQNGAYAASKAALNGFARAVALDYAPYNIRINNIALGFVLSDMNKLGLSHIENEDEKEAILINKCKHMQPLTPGRCEDVANTALYLASDMSKYLTGQTICLDGGASIKAH